MGPRLGLSSAWLTRAMKVIPLGSQTFSKSITQYPPQIAPLYCEEGEAGRLKDIDGNWYVDLVAALASVTIGYQDEEINEAVIKQLKRGVSFSLNSKLEVEVAEQIIDLVPSAEMVRFAKNGSDVTSAAIRLARAFTGRDLVLKSGYHGWHDWFIGTTSMNLGIPNCVAELTKSFRFNSIESFEDTMNQYSDRLAAVIIEPVSVIEPNLDFLKHIRARTKENGIVLIFDEIVSGFRVAKGGAQDLYGVVPDLTCLGKGIANGFPLSALTGSRQIMQLLDRVFFSGTFGGESLSLAAAKVALNRVKSGLPERLASKGSWLRREIDSIIEANSCDFLSISGHDSWLFLNWHLPDHEVLKKCKTLFMQEMIKEGILMLSSHNLMEAHSNSDLAKVRNAYSKVIPLISSALEQDALDSHLKCTPIAPLFSVRN